MKIKFNYEEQLWRLGDLVKRVLRRDLSLAVTVTRLADVRAALRWLLGSHTVHAQ